MVGIVVGAFMLKQGGYHNPYHDYFPVVPFQPADVASDSGKAAFWQHEILLNENWNGFGICGRTSPPGGELTAYAEGRADMLRPDYTVQRTNGITSPSEWMPEQLVSDDMIVVSRRSDGAGPWFFPVGFGPVLNRDGRIITYCCSR